MPFPDSADVISLSVLLRGFISIEFRTVNLAEELVAKLSLGQSQKDLAIAGGRTGLAHARLGETADNLGKVQGTLKTFGGRYFPHEIYPHLPSLRRCVCRPHGYIIAAGGAGSLGSPALLSGTWIMRYASPAISSTPTRYDGCSISSGSLPYL